MDESERHECQALQRQFQALERQFHALKMQFQALQRECQALQMQFQALERECIALESECNALRGLVFAQQLREPLADWAENQVPKCELTANCLRIVLRSEVELRLWREGHTLYFYFKDLQYNMFMLENREECSQLTFKRSNTGTCFHFWTRKPIPIKIGNRVGLAEKNTANFYCKFITADHSWYYPIQFQQSIDTLLEQAFAILCPPS